MLKLGINPPKCAEWTYT